MFKSIHFNIAIWLFSQLAFAQVDSIHVYNNKLNIKSLKENNTCYLVYMENPDGSLLNLSIWEREIKLTEDKIIIEQHWKTPDSNTTRYVYSESDKLNFAPLYHFSKWGNKIEAFDFKEGFIVGSDSVGNNQRKDFKIATTHQPFNWELDLEIIQTLPFSLGKTFVINFYHPGSKASPSSFYEYKVLRKELIKNSWGSEVECWVLEIIYDNESNATFWISTKTQQVLKMVEHYKQFTRYKYCF